MSETPQEETAWFRGHWLAFKVGLLDESDEQRFRQLAQDNPACRELQETLDQNVAEAQGEHLPPELIVRWERARRQLQGLERELVAVHLRTCEDCRQELELLGHDPRLDAAPATSSGGASPATTLEREDGRHSKIVVFRPRRFSAWTGFVGGWATLATAATLLLFFGRTPPTVPRLLVQPIPQLRVLDSGTRGGDDRGALPRLEVEPGTRAIYVRLPPTGTTHRNALDRVVREGGRVLVELRTPDGTLTRTPVSPADVSEQRGILLDAGDVLTPGDYMLRVIDSNTDQPIVGMEYPFELTYVEN